MAKESPLLGTSAAARELGLCENMVRRRADQGKIEYVRDVSGRRLFTAEAIATYKASATGRTRR